MNNFCLSFQIGDEEYVTMEIFLSLQGIGLSLVNPVPIEIPYVSLTGCVLHYHLFMLSVV